MGKKMSGVGSINGTKKNISKGPAVHPPKTRTKDKVPYKG